jgi:hypothetical protein
MSTVTDEMVEAALQSWFKDGSAWNRQMTPEVQQDMRASMRSAIESAKAVRVTAESNLQKVQIPTSTLPERFIPWRGGKCPVASGTVVECMLVNEMINSPIDAINMRWNHINADGDIIAYRIHKPADFRLEAGKFYVTASGERVGPMRVYYDIPDKFIVRYGDGKIWEIDGAWAVDAYSGPDILALSSNQESGHD